MTTETRTARDAAASRAPGYPAHLVRSVTLPGGATVVIRPITPEDVTLEQEFVRELSSESRYFRFMQALRELSPQMLSHFTRIDYDRHMAFLAVVPAGDREREIGVGRYVAAPDGTSCEFAVVVADAWHGKGVGSALMDALMDAARGRGFQRMFGDVLANNHKMRTLMRHMGFRIAAHADDARLVRVEADL
ncbi:MAG TPA: GNAT family N-acetyltransferase [Burkholderiales bacterium]|nr:GNAT family N-acetyltransferase [Burkholderiales bacterium]